MSCLINNTWPDHYLPTVLGDLCCVQRTTLTHLVDKVGTT